MNKKIFFLLFGLGLLFQSVSAGRGASKVLCAGFNGLLAFATCGASVPFQAAVGVGVTTAVASGAAMFAGHRSPGVPMTPITDWSIRRLRSS